MPSGRITKRSIDALKCPQGKDRVFLWDDGIAGFGAVRFASGKCAFVVQYRRDGRTRRFRIGEYGRLTTDEARSSARQLLAAVDRGLDPSREKAAASATPTLDGLIADFLTEEIAPKRAAGTAKLYRLYLEKHVSPSLGSRKIDSLARSDLARLHRMIGSQRPVTANRVLKVLSGLFAFAQSRGHLPTGSENPAKGINLFKEEARERFLSFDELQRLGATLREAETIGTPWTIDENSPSAKHAPPTEKRRHIHSPHVVGAIRLLLFTGCRLREVLNLRWCDVDFQREMLFLASSKTGKKAVVLNGAAVKILESLPRLGTYVIASPRGDKARPDIKKPWESIRSRAELSGLRLHDLRHSFASVGAGTGLGLPVIGKLLGHTQASTTARYAHLDADPVKRAAEQIGQHLAAALNSET